MHFALDFLSRRVILPIFVPHSGEGSSFWIRSRRGRERSENIAKAAPGGGKMAKRRLVRAGVLAMVAGGIWWIGVG